MKDNHFCLPSPMSIVNSVLLCNRVHLQKQKQTEMSTEDSTSLADGSHNLLVSEERLDLVSGISDGMQDTEAGRRPTRPPQASKGC